MNNNYEYVKTLSSNKEEQKRIKDKLKEEVNYLLISEEEKEKLIEKILQETITSYTPNIIFPFLQYTKVKLKKEIEKIYFAPSKNFTSEEKKILHLYLHQENNKFLSEEEIIKRLHLNSGAIYQTLQKLQLQKKEEEVKELYPNYKKILKERKLFFKEKTILDDDDILLIGYYIGEIEDICLDIKEISEKTNQGEKEIEKKLLTVFTLLKDPNNLNMVLNKYPNSNRMLKIKAHSLGIKLNIKTAVEEKKEPAKKILLTSKQITLLKLLNEHHSSPLSKEELATLLNHKPKQSISNVIKSLKKISETNELAKQEITNLYPHFFDEKVKSYILAIYSELLEEKPKTPKTKKRKEKKEQPLISEKQKELLKILKEHHKHPITQKEMAKILGYNSNMSIYNNIKKLKELYNSNDEAKKYILTIYPEFLEEKPKTPKTKKRKEKKERPLISEKQKELLKILKEHHKHPITQKEIAKILGYTNEATVSKNIKKLKELYNSNDEAKKYILTIYPEFLEEKPKTPKTKEKKERPLISEKQEELLKILKEHHKYPITQKEIAKILGYTNGATVSKNIKKLKELYNSNDEAKKYILTIYPEFLEEKPKTPKTKEKKERPLISEKQEELLKILKEHHKDSISLKELLKETNYSNDQTLYQIIWNIKRKAEKNPKVKKKVLEIYPEFFEKKKRKRAKKRKLTIIQKQRKDLLRILKEQHDNHLTLQQLLPLTSYKTEKTLRRAIEDTKKRCKTDSKFKDAVLELYPEFLEEEKSTLVEPTLTSNQEQIVKQKQEITETDLNILHQTYQITPPNTAYISQEEIATNMNISVNTVNRRKKKALDTINQSKEIKEQVLKDWPSFEEDRIIKENYKKKNSIKLKEKDIRQIKERITSQNIPRNKREYNHQEKILQGIINLENSIFSSYVSECTMNQKAILALRLGYFNYPLDSKSISELFHIEEQVVIDLTRNCLQSTKSYLKPKNYQKKKRELRKKS